MPAPEEKTVEFYAHSIEGKPVRLEGCLALFRYKGGLP
jgi:hypothetical protein